MPKKRARLHGDFSEDGQWDVSVPTIKGIHGEDHLETAGGVVRVTDKKKVFFVPLTSILFIELLDA